MGCDPICSDLMYMNGFSANVYINKYGEAHLEWFCLCLVMDVLLIGLYFNYRKIKKERKFNV